MIAYVYANNFANYFDLRVFLPAKVENALLPSVSMVFSDLRSLVPVINLMLTNRPTATSLIYKRFLEPLTDIYDDDGV